MGYGKKLTQKMCSIFLLCGEFKKKKKNKKKIKKKQKKFSKNSQKILKKKCLQKRDFCV